MLSKEKVILIGAPPSPYTRKMLALLRYRHIPYEMIWGNPGELLESGGAFEELGIDPPKPVLLPLRAAFLIFFQRDNSALFTSSGSGSL